MPTAVSTPDQPSLRALYTHHSTLSQANVHIPCSLTLAPYRRSRSRPTAENWSRRAMTPAYGSGRSRSAAARRRSPATGSCAARACAASSGARMGGGWSAEGGMASSRSFRGSRGFSGGLSLRCLFRLCTDGACVPRIWCSCHLITLIIIAQTRHRQNPTHWASTRSSYALKSLHHLLHVPF